MTGRLGKVVNIFARQRVDVCSMLGTQWNGGNTTMVLGNGCQYKFMWQGCPEGIHAVYILATQEFLDKMVDMKGRK